MLFPHLVTKPSFEPKKGKHLWYINIVTCVDFPHPVPPTIRVTCKNVHSTTTTRV